MQFLRKTGEALGVKLWDSYKARAEDDFYVKCMEGESEESLCNRAEELAKVYVRAHPEMRQDYIAISLDREEGPYSNMRSESEPVPAAAPTPTAPLKSRIMTINEDEGQYADRRHRMGRGVALLAGRDFSFPLLPLDVNR
jgi:hypothetical protein